MQDCSAAEILRVQVALVERIHVFHFFYLKNMIFRYSFLWILSETIGRTFEKFDWIGRKSKKWRSLPEENKNLE